MAVNISLSKEALLDYYIINSLIHEAELELFNPHKEADGNFGGSSPLPVNNREESKNIKIATDKKIARLREVEKEVSNTLKYLPGIEKEIIELIYCSPERKAKTYSDVSKITKIPRKIIKDVDHRVRFLIGQKLGY